MAHNPRTDVVIYHTRKKMFWAGASWSREPHNGYSSDLRHARFYQARPNHRMLNYDETFLTIEEVLLTTDYLARMQESGLGIPDLTIDQEED